MFNQELWDKNEWIKSDIVQEHFNMTFEECYKKFDFCRQVEWNKPPLNGQKVTTFFRKYNIGEDESG